MRIAETILKEGLPIETIPFLVGNIGPDCSMRCPGSDAFEPAKALTHWMDSRNRVHADRFFDERIAPNLPEPKAFDAEVRDSGKLNFLLGYYVHLVTDAQWDRFIRDEGRSNAMYAPSHRDMAAIAAIKKDWEDQDRLYLSQHKDSLFHAVFTRINTFPDYLELYPEHAVITRIREIAAFYGSCHGDPDREYPFLDTDALSGFIAEVSEWVLERSHPFKAVCRVLARR